MTVFKIEMRILRKPFLIWTIGFSLVVILFMAFFPAMKDESMQQLMDIEMSAMPAGLLEAFGIGEIASLTQISNYFGYIMQYMNLAIAIYAMMLGTNALIKEESQGTIEFLYAQPIQREQIIASKIGANFLIISFFVSISYLISLLLFLVLKDSNEAYSSLFTDVSTIYLGIYLVALFFLSLGFLLSTLIKSARTAIPLSLAVVFLSFMLGLLSQMIEKISFLEHFSPLQLVMPSTLLHQPVDTWSFILIAALSLLFLILTFFIYRKKDLRI